MMFLLLNINTCPSTRPAQFTFSVPSPNNSRNEDMTRTHMILDIYCKIFSIVGGSNDAESSVNNSTYLPQSLH